MRALPRRFGRGEGPRRPPLADDAGHALRAADLTYRWTFRGGHRRDIRTFTTGVNGTPMPSFFDSLKPNSAGLTTQLFVGESDFPNYATRSSPRLPEETSSLEGAAAVRFARWPIPTVGQIMEPGGRFHRRDRGRGQGGLLRRTYRSCALADIQLTRLGRTPRPRGPGPRVDSSAPWPTWRRRGPFAATATRPPPRPPADDSGAKRATPPLGVARRVPTRGDPTPVGHHRRPTKPSLFGDGSRPACGSSTRPETFTQYVGGARGTSPGRRPEFMAQPLTRTASVRGVRPRPPSTNSSSFAEGGYVPIRSRLGRPRPRRASAGP